jgi:hypothetical protein
MGERSWLEAMLDQAGTLHDNSAAEFFPDAAMRALASRPAIERELLEIVRQPAQALARRYAAVEALAQGRWMSWTSSPEDSRAAARVLAQAMAADRSHNHWGLPGAYMGRPAKILAALPTGVVESLAPLLSDSRPLTIYGSEAATSQSLARYRISDLAAYLIANHLGRPWTDNPDPAVRDIEIARLREQLDVEQ